MSPRSEGQYSSCHSSRSLPTYERDDAPAFTAAARPEEAVRIISAYTDAIEAEDVRVEHGRFGAHMAVALLNDGPVTIVFDIHDGRIR